MQISFRQELLRKCVHLSSLWMIGVMLFVPRLPAALFFAVLCLLNLAVEYASYRKFPGTGWYRKLFGKMLRENSGKFRPSGSPPYLGAAACTVFLFDRPIAITAFLCMMFGDTAAALIGRAWGSHRFSNGKSAEGCLAFFLTDCMIVFGAWLTVEFPVPTFVCGILGVGLAMLAELFNEQLHLDDNFSIPLIVGTALSCGFLF